MSKTLLFLIDSWSSMSGGIQTVNRELCLSIAQLAGAAADREIDVICIAKDCSPEDVDDASRAGVVLRRAESVRSSRADGRVLEMLFHSSLHTMLEVICVVGHSKFTGLAAQNVRAHHFPSAKLVTMYHMDVDETEGLKDASEESASAAEYSHFLAEWESRFKLEFEIASRADFVFAVGPRLMRSITSALAAETGRSPVVRELLCGVDDALEARRSVPERPTFLFIGCRPPKGKGS